MVVEVINIVVPGLLDAVMHVLFAAIAMVLLIPRTARNDANLFWKILLISIIMEVITDGAHVVNKNITHNIFFFVEVPLMIMLTGYLTDKKYLGGMAILMLAANMTHLLMDATMEGDALALYYPLYSTTYTWSFTVAGSTEVAGFIVWIITMLMMRVVVTASGINPLQFPPLSHSGKRVS